MRKWTYAYVCYAASLAIVFAIALLPVSRWDLENHFDMLTGGWHSGGNLAREWIQPVRLTGMTVYGGPYKGGRQTRFPAQNDFGAMVNYARAHKADPLALALVVRHNFMAPYNSNPSLQFPDWPGHALGEVREAAQWAAEQGTKVDDKNAFFWLSMAVFQDWSQDKEGMYKSLEQAGKCNVFNDYAYEEGEARYREMLNRFGYRGEKPHMVFQASVLLPNLAVYKHLASEFQYDERTKESTQRLADFMRVGHLMQATCTHIIGAIVGQTMVEIPLIYDPLPSPKHQSYEDKTKIADLMESARQFNALQKKLGIERPYDPVPDIHALARYRSAPDLDATWLGDPLGPAFDWRAIFGPMFLLAFFFSIVYATITFKMRPGAEWASRFLPYVAGATAFWLSAARVACDSGYLQSTPEFWWGVPPPETGQLALYATFAIIGLGIMQFFRPLRTPANILSLVGCGVLFLWTFPNPVLYLSPVAFIAAFLISRVKRKVPIAIIAPLVCGVLMGCSYLALQLTLINSSEMVIAYILVAAILATALLMTNGSRRVLIVMPALTLLISVAYLSTTVIEIRQNEDLKAGLAGWKDEANLFRAKVGIHN